MVGSSYRLLVCLEPKSVTQHTDLRTPEAARKRRWCEQFYKFQEVQLLFFTSSNLYSPEDSTRGLPAMIGLSESWAWLQALGSGLCQGHGRVSAFVDLDHAGTDTVSKRFQPIHVSGISLTSPMAVHPNAFHDRTANSSLECNACLAAQGTAGWVTDRLRVIFLMDGETSSLEVCARLSNTGFLLRITSTCANSYSLWNFYLDVTPSFIRTPCHTIETTGHKTRADKEKVQILFKSST